MSAEKIIIFDTTLRDGEQSPGASMTLEEKIRIATALDSMGVDVVEAGFAAASEGDFAAVQQIAATLKKASVCSLARANERDITAAGNAIKGAFRPRIHTFIATSKLHMAVKLKMSEQGVLAAITESVTLARHFTDDVEWSCEDGSRSERPFLYRCIEAAITAGATTINVPDTVGYAIPEEYADLITAIRHNVPNIDKAILSVHCHNDLGLAVANSLAAVKAGARQIECTINGLGERAGNAAMEEVVMAIKTRADFFPFYTDIDTTHITPTSRLVSAVTGFSVQPNKAIVGKNAFAHESGIHQDGMLKNSATYEIITPESVGLSRSHLTLGKLSGRHAFKEKLKELGFALAERESEEAFTRFKALADRKKTVYDEDIIALVDSALAQAGELIRVVSVSVACGSAQPATASVTLSNNGAPHNATATGQGPVDALFNAITTIVPHAATLELFQIHAVTAGTDAQAEVTVRLAENGKSSQGHAAHTDTLVAAAESYVAALNKLLLKRGRTTPPTDTP